METQRADKSEIRRQIREKKKQLSQEEMKQQSSCIMKKLMSMPQYEQCGQVFTYVNFNEEVVTTELIQESLRRGKQVFVPKVFEEKNRFMEFLEIHSLADLEKGYYGIPEPKGTEKEIARLRKGFFVMPGLAFDRSFHRIGYGGGFYDCYLKKKHDFFTVAVGFDFQLMDHIPSEEHDLSPQAIVTNRELLILNL